ncbi:peptide chain release factor N(5)-glutamine methyltransferase [Ramlibacter albus]|uniref:Release factor glutamine methyltransferase n=1 Tax=Ramlibacter albus TaxID=2079448 RepID=A0A923M8Z0_9BURK|nr:peptide chain release factor N(5)-glutamine methyltransferase [Ramlibacter albus]
MTVQQALAAAATMGVGRLDAQLLLLHALGRASGDRAWLLAHDTEEVGDAQAFLAFVSRRVAGEPVAYIVGEKEFYGLALRVDARVLIPRPETETLVEWALELLGCHAGLDPASIGERDTRRWIAGQARNDSPAVIDLGTGSGAIALAVKKQCPQASVEAVDASARALEVAHANAQALGLDITFHHGSWLDGRGRYDLVVTNPPYVREDDEHLAALHHEPLTALAAGPDGLADIRTIVAQAPGHLNPGGWLLLEHGWDQAETVQALLENAGFTRIQSRKDLAGINRCTGGQWPERG